MMKKITLVLIVILISMMHNHAQEAQFPFSVLATAGGTIVKNKAHISKWRLQKLNVFYIQTEDVKSAGLPSSNIEIPVFGTVEIKVFPNPVNDNLNFLFSMDSKQEFDISIYDISGKLKIIRSSQIVMPDQRFSINLEGLASSLYIVNISSQALGINKNIKINKL